MSQAENIRALMLHIMKMKHQQKSAGNAVQMTETRIYIGLNDAETCEQIYETEKYLEQLKEVCRKYQVAFSVDIEQGGYYHEDGNYTEENSLVLLLIEADPDIVRRIAKDLCILFHQESILVTENRLGGYFITCDDEDVMNDRPSTGRSYRRAYGKGPGRFPE